MAEGVVCIAQLNGVKQEWSCDVLARDVAVTCAGRILYFSTSCIVIWQGILWDVSDMIKQKFGSLVWEGGYHAGECGLIPDV